VELAAGSYVLLGGDEYAPGTKDMELPLVSSADLPLHLMNFGPFGALKTELDAFADLTDGFDCDGDSRAPQNFEDLPSGPPALVAAAELVGLTTSTWAQLASNLNTGRV
jgi:hypothetical protein